MSEEYSTDLNVSYHQSKQDTQTSFVADLFGGATATIVDAGASIWNSLPGTEDVSTADLLGRVSDNALRIYEEHPDAIHLASFIGSSFVPAGLALKGMNALRAGSKAVNWFSKIGKEADMAKVGQMFKEGLSGTTEYRSLVRGMYAKTAVNQAIDAVAMEVAVVGTLNAAPILEDYWKDPAKHFAIGVAFGGVLGGGIGIIGDHFATRSMTGLIRESALADTIGKAKVVTPNMTGTTSLQVSSANIEGYQGIIEKAGLAGKTAENDLTVATAQSFLLAEQQAANATFDALIDPNLRLLPIEAKEAIKRTAMDSNAMLGVDSIGMVNAKELEAAGLIRRPKGTEFMDMEHPFDPTRTIKIPIANLETKPILTKKLVGQDGAEVLADEPSVFFQELGLYGKLSDIKHYAGANVLGKSADAMAADLGKKFGTYGDAEVAMELTTKSAAEWQARYVGTMQRLAEADKVALAKVYIADTDTAALTAAVARIKSDPALAGTTIAVTDASNTFVRIGVPELEKAIIAEKHASIRLLMRQGIPFESMAIKTNTSLDVIQEFAIGGNKGVDAFEAILNQHAQNGGRSLGNIVNSVDDIAKVLDPAKQPLVLRGNQRKVSYADAMAGLNNRTIANINKEVTANALASSSNPAARSLGEYLFTQNGTILDMIAARLGKVNNENAGNAFFNSFDFYARNMGDVGPMVSTIGKQVQHIANSYIESVNKPLAEAMTRVSLSAAETAEFNVFREVNAGLKGWRQFDPVTGNMMQKAEMPGVDGVMQTVLQPVQFQGKEFRIVSESVSQAIVEMQRQSPELRALINANRKIKGQTDIADIGLWVPSFNPVNKHIAYVHDLSADTTQILWANNRAEHDQLVRQYRKQLAADGKTDIRVVDKGDDQAEWSRLNGRMDSMTMGVANSAVQKSGSSASAIVRSDTGVFTDIAEGYQHFVNSQMRQLADLAMSDATSTLERMSHINTNKFAAQPLTGIKAIIDKPKDSAAIMRNALIGSTNLGEYAGWKATSQSFETGLSYGVRAVSAIWDNSIGKLQKGMFGGKKPLDAKLMQKMDYEQLAAEMEAKGIHNPWAVYDKAAAEMFGLGRLHDSPDTSKRIIYASNALAATLALRIGELAQPLVNIMSLPILTGLAITAKMPESFAGIAKGTAKVSPQQIILEGARAANSPQFKALGERWEKLGYFTSMVSEANDTLKAARGMNRGFIPKVEAMLDSNIVRWMSWTSDKAEELVRRQTMFTGAVLAKRLYPGMSDEGVTIFARDFMDKAIGNFHAAQRPVLFQGTMGVALGLFQTYSLTFAQNIYRHLELKDYKALGKAALTQAGIFGVGSLPGFSTVSNAIGEHFSDDHFDLMTGTYRALPDKMADAILYGLPALAGTGLSSRGNSSFRFPGVTGDDMVALAFAKQASQGVMRVANALATDASEVPRAFAQALSLQSMSRPIARGAELATGYSITQAGNTVQVPEEVWSPTGIISRVLSTRPLEEMKLREMQHLNTYYGSKDRDNRQALMAKVKAGIRNGTLDDAQLEAASHDYMRKGGSPQGWRSAYATALGTTETSGKETFANLLRPDTPFNFMLGSLDGGH